MDLIPKLSDTRALVVAGHYQEFTDWCADNRHYPWQRTAVHISRADQLNMPYNPQTPVYFVGTWHSLPQRDRIVEIARAHFSEIHGLPEEGEGTSQ